MSELRRAGFDLSQDRRPAQRRAIPLGSGGKMATSVDEWVCRENLKRLGRQLEQAQDQDERSLLSELIAHERAKLDQLARKNKPS